MMQNFQPAICLIKVCLGRYELESIKKMLENSIEPFTFFMLKISALVYHGKIRMANRLQHKIAQIVHQLLRNIQVFLAIWIFKLDISNLIFQTRFFKLDFSNSIFQTRFFKLDFSNLIFQT